MNHSIHQLLARACFHAHIGVAAACLATLSPQSNAQVSLWNGTSGLWTDPANWQGGLVPNSPTSIAQFDAQGIYTITHPATSTTLLGLNLLNQTSLLNFQGGSIINVGMNGIHNDSFILLNSTNTLAPTQIFATEPFALTGSGFLSLNAPADDLEAASLAAADSETVILHAAPHVVRGTGTIHANLHNNSIIEADLPQRTLRLATHPKFNTGAISAINGSILRLESPLVQSGTGVVRADNSLVQISAPISNGSLVASGSNGLFKFSSGTSLDNVTLSGEASVEETTAIYESLTNHGSLRIPPMSSQTVAGINFYSSSAFLIGGTGEIVLSANNAASGVASIQFRDRSTHLAGHTIRGEGSINSTLLFTNLGMIVADVSSKNLNVNLDLHVNGGTLAVRNNGRLRMSGELHQIDQGEILADNCTLLLDDLGLRSIRGGFLRSSGEFGLLQLSQRSATLIDVTFDGILHIDSTTLSIQGSLTNNGTLVVSAPGDRATVRGSNDVILKGTGTLVLNDRDGAQIELLQPAYFLTNSRTHTIRGEGSINANIRNEGLIISDRVGKRLDIRSPNQTGAFNSGDLIAQNGSELFTFFPVIQTPDLGRIFASGGVVTLRSQISDGALYSNSGGIIRITNGPLDRVRNYASIVIPSGSSCTVRETIENSGTITINETGFNSTTRLNFNPLLVVTGSGQLILNSTPDALDAAAINNPNVDPQGQIVLPQGQSIAGNGSILGHFVIQGALMPGLETNDTSNPIGVIGIPPAGSLSLAPTSLVELQISGPGSFEVDRITSQSPINLEGGLRITMLDGYVPTPGDSWTILTASPISGTFSQLLLPSSNSGTSFRIVYTDERVVLEYYCTADINSDGGVDGGDIQSFFSYWEDSEPRADVNNDGGVDGADIELFFGLWERGGC